MKKNAKKAKAKTTRARIPETGEVFYVALSIFLRKKMIKVDSKVKKNTFAIKKIIEQQ